MYKVLGFGPGVLGSILSPGKRVVFHSTPVRFGIRKSSYRVAFSMEQAGASGKSPYDVL